MYLIIFYFGLLLYFVLFLFKETQIFIQDNINYDTRFINKENNFIKGSLELNVNIKGK